MAERELAAEEEEDNVLDLPTGAVPDSVRRLAAHIRHARERKGWSQRNLAEYAHLNHEAIRRIESGQADPRFGVVSRLCKLLDISERKLRQIMLGQTSAARAEQENGK